MKLSDLTNQEIQHLYKAINVYTDHTLECEGSNYWLLDHPDTSDDYISVNTISDLIEFAYKKGMEKGSSIAMENVRNALGIK